MSIIDHRSPEMPITLPLALSHALLLVYQKILKFRTIFLLYRSSAPTLNGEKIV